MKFILDLPQAPRQNEEATESVLTEATVPEVPAPDPTSTDEVDV